MSEDRQVAHFSDLVDVLLHSPAKLVLPLLMEAFD